MSYFKLNKAKIFFCIVFLSAAFSVFAQHPQNPGNESWKMFQKAQALFDQKNYGKSIKLANDCLAQRKKEVEYIDYVLANALKPYPVRKVGDDINEVLTVLRERDEYESVEIIETYINEKGEDYFDSSISKLTEYLHKRQDYPEVYFLIAKIYRLEGEFDMAYTYLEKAHASSFLLEIPAQDIDILYEMAAIAKNKNDVPRQEKLLELIAVNDGRYSDTNLKNALLRTSRSTKEDNSSRFFELYRIDAIRTVNAYYSLSKIYDNAKEREKAYLANLYAVLISFTHINSILEERESDYHYKNLTEFFDEIKKYPDIVEWCGKNHFWEGFYNIYTLGVKNKCTRFPVDVVNVLAKSCPEVYWKNAAIEAASKIREEKQVTITVD
ncbi:MAG: hypothetical protein K6E69_01275 [Treponema sp.]|uniref:tetratricopeptide repeat protein n=1 Tax=Treponema sp. TaxID=166 RepID=UPI00298D6EDF|nr:hypothetical protein [Treponema sp.]MCR5385729.1 hypothetical protein [Treponema sp.]